MNNLDSILKSRDITLPTNVHLVKAMVLRPDPLLTSGRGCACIFPQDADSPIYIRDKLIRHVAVPKTSGSPIASITKEEPAGRGGKINIEIPARLTGLLQCELQPENNSTYSVLACLPSPYVFLYQQFWKT